MSNKPTLVVLIFSLIFLSAVLFFLKRRADLNRAELEAIVEKHSLYYDIDPLLVKAVIEVESNWRIRAVSEKNARGLMQILPSTGEELAQELKILFYDESSLFDPSINIRMGIFYLHKLKLRFGERKLVLAAYHAGPTRVSSWLEKETGLSAAEVINKHAGPKTKHYVYLVEKKFNQQISRHP